MDAGQIWQQFVDGMIKTPLHEYIAVFAGITSVWFSKKENVLVYPVGLINTVIYIYISLKGSLFGEAGVNLYYTIMSVIGWYMWLKKDNRNETALHITRASKKEWVQHIMFFLFFYISIFLLLTYLKEQFYEGVIPWADALASATAFTGMWLMTKKKVESWYWWIATNIASIPLYFVKQYVFTSLYYLVLLVLAVLGLMEWMKKAKQTT